MMNRSDSYQNMILGLMTASMENNTEAGGLGDTTGAPGTTLQELLMNERLQ